MADQGFTNFQFTPPIYAYTSLVLILAIFGFLSVSLVLWSQFSSSTLSPRNILVIMLLFSDWLLVVAALVTNISNISSGGFIIGRTGCLIDCFSLFTSVLGNILSLGAIAWERYYSIVMRKTFTLKHAHLLLVGIGGWVLVGSIFFLVLAIPSSSQIFSVRPAMQYCALQWSMVRNDVPTLVLVVCVLPSAFITLPSMAYAYTSIIMVYSKAKRTSTLTSARQQATEKRLLAMAILLTLSFSCCWLPVIGVDFYEMFTTKVAPASWDGFAGCCVLLNTIFDPLLLIKFDGAIRRDVYEMLGWDFRSPSGDGSNQNEGGTPGVIPSGGVFKARKQSVGVVPTSRNAATPVGGGHEKKILEMSYHKKEESSVAAVKSSQVGKSDVSKPEESESVPPAASIAPTASFVPTKLMSDE